MFTISEMFKKIHYGGSQYEKLKTGRKQECDLNLVFRTPEDIRYLPYTCCGMGCKVLGYFLSPPHPPPHALGRLYQGNIKYLDFVRETSNMQILLGKYQICRFCQGNIKYVDFFREISNMQILLGKYQIFRFYQGNMNCVEFITGKYQIFRFCQCNIKYEDFVKETSNMQILLGKYQICRFKQGIIKDVDCVDICVSTQDFVREISNMQILLRKYIKYVDFDGISSNI